MNVIEVDDVKKSFGHHTAVDGVSFSVAAGSIRGLIDRNGAGKTTTIRMVMGIYPPDSGTITFKGNPVDASFRDHVGYLPEERGLYPKMQAKEALCFFAQIKLAERATATRTLKPCWSGLH